MNLFVILFVALMWLPGHLALRLSATPQDGERRWSLAERLFIEVAFSGLVMLWNAVVLGLVGWFSPFSLLAGAAVPTVVLLVMVLWRGRGEQAGGWAPDLNLAIVVLLLGLAAWFYQPAFEQVIGGRDPTTYLLSGINLGRTGSWVSYDEVVTTLEGVENRHNFLGTTGPGRFDDWGPRFVGWYLMDPDEGKVVPQGLPLYPSSIGVGYLLGGARGATRVTSFLAAFAAVALFFLSYRLASRTAALTAALLLIVSPAQVWFARFSNAETLAQVLLVVGLYCLLIYRRHGGWFFALGAALAFGLTWQSHIWMIWLVLPLGALLAFDLVHGNVDRESLLAFWAPLVALGLQALLVYATVTTAYLWGVFAVLRWSATAGIPAIVAVAAILFGLWSWGRSRARASEETDDESSPVGWARKGVAVGLAAAAIYGYAFRPMLSAAWSAESVQRLTLATGVTVFALAVAGAVMMLLDRRRGGATLCFLLVALGVMVPILWEPKIIRVLMWSLRRYQTFLPLIYVFAAIFIWAGVRPEALRSGRWRVADVAARGAVAALLVGMLATTGVHYRGFKQPGDSIALIEQVSATLEDDAALVFEARSGWGVLDLAPAFAYWKGRDVLWLHIKDRPSAARVLRDFVRGQAQRGRSVYFFTQGFNHHMSEPRMEPHGRWWFYQTELEEVLGELPDRLVSSRFPFSVYRLEATGANEPLDGVLDVGYWDDNYVGEALPWEANWIYSARWTKATGVFWLPGVDEETTEITVHAMTVEGSEAANRTLTAVLDGIVLGELPIEQDWTDYVFEVPSDWRPAPGTAPRLVLTTEPLQPDEVAGNGDTRYLGVLVNAILWR